MHMDGDAFFVGCEMAAHPKLRGKPVVSGGERGIATAVSYEARALGVSRGMPIFQLRKLFPQVIVQPGDYELYANISQKMFDIVRRYVDDVEEYSIDECFADLTYVTRMNKMSYEEIARAIKRNITRELGITVSLGVAPTKVLAKVASKWQKPDGLTMLPGTRIQEFLPKVEVDKLWGVGPSSAQYLRRHGVKTALDLASQSEAWADEVLGKNLRHIWLELRGVRVSRVDASARDSYSSISRTRTFHPSTNNETFLLSQLAKHLEDACAKARQYGLAARKVSFFIKTKEFRYHACDLHLDLPTNAPEIIFPAIRREFGKVRRPRFLYRASGVHLRELVSTSLTQGDLFGEGERVGKFEVIHKTVDELAQKFGKHTVYLASADLARKQEKNKAGRDFDDPSRDLLFL